MAYEIDEILGVVQEVVEVWKPYNPDYKKGRKAAEDGQVPPYYPMYRTMVEYCNVIKPHAEKGEFPTRLFEERSPNQTDEEYNYIKNNFKQKTLPLFLDFVNVVSRSFNDNNWSIDYKKEGAAITEENSFEKYVTNEVPVYGSLESFIKNSMPSLKLKDANGVIAIKPYYVPRNEEGELMNEELVNPYPCYYSSEQVVSFKDKDYFLIELEEKSPVKYGNQIVEKGKVYYFFDDENIWYITQVGDWQDFEFKIELYYGHNIGAVPVTRLMGVPQVYNNNILYQSPFLFAVDNLDLVLLNSSNLQLSINNCVYPYRVMVGDICDFEDNEGNVCDRGTIYDHEHTTNYRCPKCNGSGLRSRVSPLGVMLLKPPTQDDEISEANISTPMQYISPDTSALEFLRQQIAEDFTAAKNILHIHDSTTEVQGQENLTATGRAIDQKQMFSFIKPISDQMFEIYAFCLDAIGLMRYGERYAQPTLIPSQSFDFLTSEDYLVQINEAVEAKLPPFVIHTLVYKYLNTLFYNDIETSKVFKLIIAADRLLTLDDASIQGKILGGTVARWESLLHDSGVNLIKELQETEINFFDLDIEMQKEKLFELAKQKAENSDERVNADPFDVIDRAIGNNE